MQDGAVPKHLDAPADNLLNNLEWNSAVAVATLRNCLAVLEWLNADPDEGVDRAQRPVDRGSDSGDRLVSPYLA